jgi:dihydrofolate reductase
MSVSLDGYVAGRDGSFDWSAPDEELHRFHNQRVAALGAQLLGRRLYETMLSWETAAQDPAITDYAHEFAGIWLALPKVVFSTTLREVVGRNTRLAPAGVREAVERLKAEPGEGDIGVGGAGLAAACARLDLIDEYELFVCPVVVGGGTPYFPELDRELELELVETRTFASRVVHLRYRRVRTTDVSI